MKVATLVFGSALVLASSGTGIAGVNCKYVNKMLDMGRSVDEIVTTSAGTITEDDIEACKAQKTDAGTPPAGGEQKKEEGK